jgi:hypothetical protein
MDHMALLSVLQISGGSKRTPACLLLELPMDIPTGDERRRQQLRDRLAGADLYLHEPPEVAIVKMTRDVVRAVQEIMRPRKRKKNPDGWSNQPGYACYHTQGCSRGRGQSRMEPPVIY